MERLFQILAVILIGVAAYFLWTGSAENAFVAGVVGAVCFFLSVRFQVKDRMKRREFGENENAGLIEETEDEGEIIPADTFENGKEKVETH